MSHSITPDHLGTYSSNFNADRASRVARDAVMSGGLLNSCKNPEAIRRGNHQFSLSLKQGKMTNQKQKNAAAAGSSPPPTSCGFALSSPATWKTLSCPRAICSSGISWKNPTGF